MDLSRFTQSFKKLCFPIYVLFFLRFLFVLPLVKTVFKINPYPTMLHIENLFIILSCTLLFFTIVLLMVNFKEGRIHFVVLATFLASLLFWIALNTQIIKVSPTAFKEINLLCGMLVTPLIMLLLVYFSSSNRLSSILKGSSALFLVLNTFVGYSFSDRLILHFGIILLELIFIILIGLYFCKQSLNIKLTPKFNFAKSLLLGTILFGNLCLLLILGLVQYLKIYFQEEVYLNFFILINLVTFCIFIANVIILLSRSYHYPEQTRIGIYEEEINFL